MINGNNVVAIIPARGGSKGLPGKNVKELCGKPLIAWTIKAALASKHVDEVVVTTDSKEIAVIAMNYGASVPFLRPGELASDTASSFETVKHTLEFYENEFSRRFSYMVLLEPTSPLREDDDIDLMLEKLDSLEAQFDGIISLGEVHEHPSIMKKIAGDLIEPFVPELTMTSRRQDNNAAYFPYGVAYIVKTPVLLAEKTFYPRRTTHHTIKRYQCREIDDIYDFLAVENIMKFEWNLK